MDEQEVLRVICQYLHERGFSSTVHSLTEESGRSFVPDSQKTGELQKILDEHTFREAKKKELDISVERLFPSGEGEFVNQLWCSFDDLGDGNNILTVKLTENGSIVFTTSKALLGKADLLLPLSADTPPITPIPSIHHPSKGAILAVDFHPKKRHILLCGTMDRLSFIADLDRDEDIVTQRFQDHTKYVVKVKWSPSGKYFVTGSYDHSFAAYREKDDSSGTYELMKKLNFCGTVEGLGFAKDSDTFVVGVRNDYQLYCYDLTNGEVQETRTINLNKFGDDYVSFSPMHISFSQDGHYFLVSTDRDRVIMYCWETGQQIANFYGATNDEYSQPRHCWDPSGKYIYGTSQDHSICVWEIRSMNLVARLEGHTAIVRDIHFCEELGMLISCGFDGTLKLWRKI